MIWLSVATEATPDNPEVVANWVAVIAGVVVLLGNLAIALPQVVQLAKVRQQVGDASVLIRDTEQLRAALMKPLEGTWRVAGLFNKFQGADGAHHTFGYMTFTWDPAGSQYSVVYAYSAMRESGSINVATAICHGHARADVDGRPLRGEALTLDMLVDARTAHENHNNATKSFRLQTSGRHDWNRNLYEIEFPFNTRATSGVVKINR